MCRAVDFHTIAAILGAFILLLLGTILFVRWRKASESNPAATVSLESDYLRELWSVGDSDQDAVLFQDIHDIAVDSKGTVFVVDYGRPVLYAFSGSGELIREIGREGRGPGEFERLYGVFVGEADTVYTWDFDMRRVTAFSPDDYSVAATVNVEDGTLARPSRLVGVTPNSFVLTFSHAYKFGDDVNTPKSTDLNAVDRHNGSIQGRQPIAVLPVRTHIAHYPGDGSITVAPMPFRLGPQFEMDVNGQLYFADRDSARVSVLSTDGRVHQAISWDYSPVPVTKNEANEALKDTPRAWRNVLRERGIAEAKPAIRRFVVDNRSRVWIQLSAPYGAPTAACLVYKVDGSFVGITNVPSNLQLFAIRNDRAYGVLNSEEAGDILTAYSIKL